ncbi:MAG: hypothetical protein H8E66_02545 [Planctomycetes bacterium]|nr:hypothetical protein [Planctomycetota bacterium]
MSIGVQELKLRAKLADTLTLDNLDALADWLAVDGRSEEAALLKLLNAPETGICHSYGDGDRRGDGDARYGHRGMYLQDASLGDGRGDGYGDPNNCNGDGYGGAYDDVQKPGDGWGDGFFGDYGASGWDDDESNGDGEGRGSLVRGHLKREEIIRKEILMKGQYILVCDAGFVLVGEVRPNPDDFMRLLVDHCACVRRWGTTRGLGQLAREGVQPETELDPEGDNVDVLRSFVLRAIPCDEESWKSWFAG